MSWSAIIVGAVAAAALALVLNGFAAAIGLAVSSTAPTWRDASLALVALSGLYLVLVAQSDATPDETEFRDGAHGAAAWALATLLTALIAFGGAQALTRLAAPRAVQRVHRRQSAARTSSPMISIVCSAPTRNDVNLEYIRAEAGRILLTTSSRRGVLPEDRTELIRLVTARTGLAQPEAERG